MGGTPRKKVHGRRRCAARTMAVSNLGNMAIVAPRRRPATWPLPSRASVSPSDVRKVAAVITRGYLIYPREIHTALGIQPFVAQQPPLRTLPVQPGDSGSLSTARR